MEFSCTDFRPPQPLLWDQLTVGIIVGHVWYTPTLGLEGKVLRIHRLQESVLIKFWGDECLKGSDLWSRQEVETFIFYLGASKQSYFASMPEIPTDPPDINLLAGRGSPPTPSWVTL